MCSKLLDTLAAGLTRVSLTLFRGVGRLTFFSISVMFGMISSDSDEDQTLEAVNPVTISGDDDDEDTAATTLTTTITIPSQQKKAASTSGLVQNAVIQTGTTTIVLPVITTSRNGKQVSRISYPSLKRWKIQAMWNRL